MFQRIFAAVAVLFTGKMPVADSELRRAVGFETRRNAQVSRGNPQAVETAPNWIESHKSAVLALLSDSRFRFRSIGALMAGIGSDDAGYVRNLAALLGARTDYNNADMFGLKSRVGETGRRGDRPAPVEQVAFNAELENDKDTIRGLLADSRFRFRSIGALSRALGARGNDSYVRELAAQVGARAEYHNADMFGLKERVGETGRRPETDYSDDDEFGGE